MNIYFRASPADRAQEAFRELTSRYGQTENVSAADVIVTLGGDGETLKALGDSIRFQKPVFGMNFGHYGHFQNEYASDQDLIERISVAETFNLRPLRAEAWSTDGQTTWAHAINEAQIVKVDPRQAINMRVLVNGREVAPLVRGDGLIVASNLGSTAYNNSIDGPILPFGDDLLALTPISQIKPHTMNPGAMRSQDIIRIEVIDTQFRPAQAFADGVCLGKNISAMSVTIDNNAFYSIMFDRNNEPHTRVLRVQFPRNDRA
jgi:NAD+ kinase